MLLSKCSKSRRSEFRFVVREGKKRFVNKGQIGVGTSISLPRRCVCRSCTSAVKLQHHYQIRHIESTAKFTEWKMCSDGGRTSKAAIRALSITWVSDTKRDSCRVWMQAVIRFRLGNLRRCSVSCIYTLGIDKIFGDSKNCLTAAIPLVSTMSKRYSDASVNGVKSR